MTLLTYQVFKTVADIGSFHKAADILGLTPSAISHAISSMETELGFSVMTRGKNGIALTNYGEHLLPYVNAVLNSDESLQQVIAEMNGLRTGKVKIGVFSSVCTNWLPDILRSFQEKVILIAGGYDKHIPFDVLGPEIVAHVKLLVLCGATADKIKEAVEHAPGYAPGKPEIAMVSPFRAAVEFARDRAVSGDVVTLSPACAAFDQFQNFMVRGKTFKTIVNSWEE